MAVGKSFYFGIYGKFPEKYQKIPTFHLRKIFSLLSPDLSSAQPISAASFSAVRPP
ncbi:hypothetical protein RchiOBHm_Chr4g0404761 [Rosa chinensis]|uniref:Uncharacterized protein n=1 Tax=Rosa chinensis TaxID=74649 RepID=A0A2P6QU16_ROSCH|nr:hypothetical protein RchiOBHm_Chr4g0404761 [Rosa chinensis]